MTNAQPPCTNLFLRYNDVCSSKRYRHLRIEITEGGCRKEAHGAGSQAKILRNKLHVFALRQTRHVKEVLQRILHFDGLIVTELS